MENSSSKNTTKKKIIVVGAGAAGLYAASLLIEKGYEVTLLEASKRTGGRIWTSTDKMPYKLELGAEFIHGKHSLWYKKIVEVDDDLYKEEDSSFLWRENLFTRKRIRRLQDARQYFSDYEDFYDKHHRYKGEDISLKHFLEERGITPIRQPDAYRWYEAFAAALGTNVDNLGLKSLAIEAYLWESGRQDYRIMTSFESFLEDWKAKTKPSLQLEKPVIKVTSSNEEVEIVTKDLQNYKADAVLITVPLTQLKAKKITFVPELPVNKQDAIDKIGMDKYAIKFFLNFSKRFWSETDNEGEEMLSLLGMQAANEYWETVPYNEDSPPPSYGLTAFILGDKAKNYTENNFSKEQILESLITELDTHFKGNASASLLKSDYLDWAKVEYIEGAYSYPSVGSHEFRKHLASPVENKIFFAGEATHTQGQFATIHGALETAERAVGEIVEVIKNP